MSGGSSKETSPNKASGVDRRATLVVCPTSLVSHWVEQLDQHTHTGVELRLKIHHGQGKALTGTELETQVYIKLAWHTSEISILQDVVVTTYGTLAAELDLEDLSPLLRARWLRTVLDEGHNIKNHNSKAARAALGLNTERKWIVTGTPIQVSLLLVYRTE